MSRFEKHWLTGCATDRNVNENFELHTACSSSLVLDKITQKFTLVEKWPALRYASSVRILVLEGRDY